MPEFSTSQIEKLKEKATLNKPEDPTGEHPRVDYLNRLSVNKAAAGEERNDLKWAAFTPESKAILNDEFADSILGFNQVSRSITGHVIEIDDTYGNQRILIKHRDGAGIELRPDGGVSISSLKTRVDCIGGTQEFIVEGDANLTYKGNLNLNVTGEFNIECLDLNIKTKGNKTETIIGNNTERIYKNNNTSIVGEDTRFITTNKTETILGGYIQNVKLDSTQNIEGNVNVRSDGKTDITSKDFINIASDKLSASGNTVSIQGGDGVIGGESVHIKGEEGSFEKSVEAPNFWGNLIGKAKFAALADKATGATTAGMLGSAGTAGFPSETPPVPSFVAPTTSGVAEFLSKAAGGIKKVRIDVGNYLKDFIDRTNFYNGLSNHKLSAAEARSKLRDEKNRGNNKFIQSLIKEGTISENYNDPTPPRIGRIVDGESTTVIGTKQKEATVKTQKSVNIPRNDLLNFLPDPKYNPMFADDITIRTKLSDTYSIAKFLGSDDATNMKYIRDLSERKYIARHLYLQTVFMKKIQENNDEFDGVILQVTEGLYRPASGEKITPGSINELKSRGRAVVYKAVDSTGKENNDKLFEIAVFLKDNASFEELILAYDTLENDKFNRKLMSGRIIMTMPEIDENFSGKFSRKVKTTFNDNLISNNELSECKLQERYSDIPEPVYPIPDESDYLVWEVSEAAKAVDPKLIEILIQISKAFGEPLVITSGYRSPKDPTTGSKGVGLSSAHVQKVAVDIRANFNDSKKAELIEIAIDKGIKGIGIYTLKGGSSFNGLHFDIKERDFAINANIPEARWAWGDNYSKDTLPRYPWAQQVLSKYGILTA